MKTLTPSRMQVEENVNEEDSPVEPIEEGGSIEISEGSSIESLEGGSIEFSTRQLRKKSKSSNEKYNEFKEIGTRLAQAAAKWRGKSYDKLLEVANFLLDKAEGQEQDLSEFHVSMFKSSITELPTRLVKSASPQRVNASQPASQPAFNDPPRLAAPTGKTAKRKKNQSERASGKGKTRTCTTCGLQGHQRNAKVCKVNLLGKVVKTVEEATRDLQEATEELSSKILLSDPLPSKTNIKCIQTLARCRNRRLEEGVGQLTVCCVYGEGLRDLGHHHMTNKSLEEHSNSKTLIVRMTEAEENPSPKRRKITSVKKETCAYNEIIDLT